MEDFEDGLAAAYRLDRSTTCAKVIMTTPRSKKRKKVSVPGAPVKKRLRRTRPLVARRVRRNLMNEY